MRKAYFLRSVSIAAALLVLVVGRVHAQVPAPSDRLVVDNGAFLEPVEERALERKIRAYNDSTSTQIVVLTVEDLGGMDAQEFALQVGRSWGVGQAGQNNGVIVLISRAERQIRIEVGYGLEGALPDALVSRIVRDTLTPAFRQGQFFAGINAAVDLIMAAAAGEFEGLPEGNPGRSVRIDPVFLYLAFIFIFFIISGIRNRGNGGGRYKKRRHADMPIIFWGGGLSGRSSGGGFGGGGFGGGGFGGGGAGGSW
ncbi:MAG: TPM domain-containing protein [Bacteroidetes bacterium]|nr:TPM domain-containing protein [Bacteroidota bacterium]